MNTTITIDVADRVAELAEQVRQDVAAEQDRTRIYQEIRALRRSIVTLEAQLAPQDMAAHGDAC